MGAGCSARSDIDPRNLSIDHFEVHRVVGQGGFGKVNAVIRKKTKPPQWYAMKTLSKSIIIERGCVQMIWNERNLLAGLRCPHIVKMHHAFQDRESCYVVMDLLLGGDLKYHLKRRSQGGFEENRVRFYAAGLVVALRYLHSQGILHRDIKPDNVILDNDGYPQLTDFGISIKNSALRHMGNSGTTSYMAPEMFTGTAGHGIAADFYALGITTYELLTGQKPWTTSAKSRIDENPSILDGIPTDREVDYYPPQLLDSNTLSSLSLSCRSFLRELLYPVESGRLGYARGTEELAEHEWFNGFDWEQYESRKLQAPFAPNVDMKHANCDTSIQDFDDVLERSSRRGKSVDIKPEDERLFDGFEYNVTI